MRPFGERLAAAIDERGRLCVGIDPHPPLLAAWGLADDAAGLREFSLRVVEALTGVVAVFKPQAAFYERHGSAGMAVLEETMGRKKPELLEFNIKAFNAGYEAAGKGE